MKISRTVALAALALAIATGSSLAGFKQTPAQIAADLKNPHNTTYVPSTSSAY